MPECMCPGVQKRALEPVELALVCGASSCDPLDVGAKNQTLVLGEH